MMPAASGQRWIQQQRLAHVRRRRGCVPLLLMRNRRYDFGNRFEFGLKMMLDASTRSIPDNGGINSLAADCSVTTPGKPAPLADRRPVQVP